MVRPSTFPPDSPIYRRLPSFSTWAFLLEGGIPMMRDELVGSVVLGAMAALISMLVWGRSLVDLIAAGT
jgi:uncharacterized protein (DUF2062 family)